MQGFLFKPLLNLEAKLLRKRIFSQVGRENQPVLKTSVYDLQEFCFGSLNIRIFPHRHAIRGPTVHFVSHPATPSCMCCLNKGWRGAEAILRFPKGCIAQPDAKCVPAAKSETSHNEAPDLLTEMKNAGTLTTFESQFQTQTPEFLLFPFMSHIFELLHKNPLLGLFGVHGCRAKIMCPLCVHRLTFCLHIFPWCSSWALSFCVTQMWGSDCVTQDPSNQTRSRPSSGRQVLLQ